jgi:hypothetical protein
MAVQKRDDQHLEAHPLLTRLLDAGPNVRAFRGYVGPDEDSGRVRLYQSLGDLSFNVEIRKSDIVASAAAPESLLPHGGTVIWVKPDAEVVCHGDRIGSVPARRPRQTAPAGAASALHETHKSARLVEVQKGRLSIQLRARVMSTCSSCSCSSCETNPGCKSTCNQMVAMPSVVVGP